MGQKPYWKLNLFRAGEYQENYFMGTDKILYKNDVFLYNANVSTQITLDKAKTWDLNLSYVYNSKTIQGSFDISSSQRTNVIINKKMFDKKLEVGLVFNDISERIRTQSRQDMQTKINILKIIEIHSIL